MLHYHTHSHAHTPQDSVPSGSLQFFHGHSDSTMKKGGYTVVSITSTLMNVTFYSHKGRSNPSL